MATVTIANSTPIQDTITKVVTEEKTAQSDIMDVFNDFLTEKITWQEFKEIAGDSKIKQWMLYDRSVPMSESSGFTLTVDLLNTFNIFNLKLDDNYELALWALMMASRNVGTLRKTQDQSIGTWNLFSQEPEIFSILDFHNGPLRARVGSNTGKDISIKNAWTWSIAGMIMYRIKGALMAELGKYNGPLNKYNPTQGLDVSTPLGKARFDYRLSLIKTYNTLFDGVDMRQNLKNQIWNSPFVNSVYNAIYDMTTSSN